MKDQFVVGRTTGTRRTESTRLSRRWCASLAAGFALVAVGLVRPALADDADSGLAAPAGGDVPAAASQVPASLEQVIVTAQKQAQRLQDVPVPVTSISAESLLQNGQTRLPDYFARIPGVDYASNVRGAPVIAIRGLSTGTDLINPTVSIVVDDVPFGASTALGGGDSTPDLDPSDLQRIEVLRGPQGTLYGANSLGGLIKFVTVEPSTDRLSGRFQAGLSGINNGDGSGYNLRGSVNVPLSETQALLVSAFTHHEPGYIDNPSRGLRGVNASESSGARLSMLWRPDDSFSIKLGALFQRTKTDGSGHVEIQTGVGDLQQNDVPNTGEFEKKLQAYSATIKAKLGHAELTSVTGYSINRVHDLVDYSVGFSFLGAATQAGLGIPNGTTGSTMDDDNKTTRFTQELRLSLPLADNIDWLVGGYFDNEHSPYTQTFYASNPATGAYLGQWAVLGWNASYREFAGFTDLTCYVNDRFDVQLGARQADIRQTYHETDSGPLVPIFEGNPSPLFFNEVVTHSTATTYLLTPRFKISPNLMVYARLASGYRPGGPNQTASAFNLPLSYKPDQTQSVELGVKGDLAEYRVSFDASIYHIDWKDIQLNFIDPASGFGFNSNANRATSDGLEVSAEFRPFTGFSIATSLAYNRAVLKDPFPASSAVYGASGDRLPFSPRLSGTLAVRDEFPITAEIRGFAGFTASFVGDRVGNFTSAPPSPTSRQTYAGYARVDLQTGVRLDPWTASLYANNVTDRRGVLYGGLGTLPNSAAFQDIQPRTVGVNLVRDF